MEIQETTNYAITIDAKLVDRCIIGHGDTAVLELYLEAVPTDAPEDALQPGSVILIRATVE